MARWLEGRVARVSVGLVCLGLAGALVAGFFGHLHPALDSVSHFRMHLVVLAALTGGVLLILRHPAIGVVLLALAGAVTGLTWQGVAPEAAEQRLTTLPPYGERAAYRILHLNLRYNNPTPEKVLSLIGRTRPDILALTEVSDMWRERLEIIAHAYPHSIICPPPSRIGGVAILSRRPFAAGGEPQCHERCALAIAQIDFSGETLNVAALHLGWPWPFDQPRALPRVTRQLAGLRGPGIVAGDFNAAPWSWTVRHVARTSGFRVVEGVGPTWLFLSMPDWLRRGVGLPIDHLMAKGGVIPHAIDRRGDAGSDHLPILMEFSLPPQEPRRQVLRADLSP
ncbi:MAG: endonuclease/exonuclease/phosphatase family protein [Rhizobiaceae bacterium]